MKQHSRYLVFRLLIVMSAIASSALVLEAGKRWN